MKRRIISLVLALSLLAGSAFRPQRANAVAVTATVVAAASAAAILTACGVSYWAATQTDAIDYISGKLEDYLESIEVSETPSEWLGISATSQPFTVITGGAMQFTSAVANKLLGFARWFQNEEGIESGGISVGNGGLNNIQQSIRGAFTGDAYYENIGSGVKLVFSEFTQSNSSQKFFNCLVPVQESEIQITITSISGVQYEGSWSATSSDGSNLETYMGVGSGLVRDSKLTLSSTSGYVLIGVNIGNMSGKRNGIVEFAVTNSNLEYANTATITPSDFVNVPSDIASDGTFNLKPSVSLASGDSVDTASEAILDGITSEDGLSSTVEETPSTAWGWLYTLLVNIANAITDGVSDIKQALFSLADSIYNKFIAILTDIKNGVATLKQDVVTALGEVKQAVIGIPSKIDEAKQAVLGLPSRIAEAVRGLFVPAEGWSASFVGTLYNAFADRVGVLTYPLAVAESFLMRFLTENVGEPVITWGTVREPFSQQILIQAGSYNFNSMLADEQIARVYGILQLVLKTGMAFALFELCRKKYNTIIHGGAS